MTVYRDEPGFIYMMSCAFEKDDNFTYTDLELTMHEYTGLLDDQNYYSSHLQSPSGPESPLIEFTKLPINKNIIDNLFKPAAELNAAGTKCDLEITGVFSLV